MNTHHNNSGISLEEKVFNVLRENLLAVQPDFKSRDVVLCPICLREISRDDILTGGIEHIIPRAVIKNVDDNRIGTKNQRSGITVLCRTPRLIKSNGNHAPNGCNGFKGSKYDFILKSLLNDDYHGSNETTFRHGVAILIMAYLGAFQSLGYEYILRPELDDIREQFDYPDKRISKWLETAQYNKLGTLQIKSTTSGNPFIWGGIINTTAPLNIMFRRCRANLPNGHWEIKNGVRHLDTFL